MKIRRQRLQFSIRGLLLLVTACCVALGIAVSRVRTQQHAVSEIEAVYGEVFYDFHETGPDGLDLNRQSSDPAWLRELLGPDALHDVVAVNLDSPAVTDATLKELRNLPALRRVFLFEASISNRGLDILKTLPKIRKLSICSCPGIDDDALARLAGLGQVEHLDLQALSVTDAGLRHLKGNVGLRRISLDRLAVTEEGVAELRTALPNCVIDY